MNARPPRLSDVEREHLARLLPAPAERDLPASRHQSLKEHFMTQIQHEDRHVARQPQPPAQRRSRLLMLGLPLAGAATAGALVFGGTLRDQDAPTARTPVAAPPSGTPEATMEPGTPASQTPRTEAAVLLDRISAVSRNTPTPTVRDDQFVYVRTWGASSVQTQGDPRMALSKPSVAESWRSVDGSRDEHDQNDVSTGEISLSNPHYRYLESLPTDPQELRKKIYEETRGAGNGPDEQAFVVVGDLLRGQVVPPAVSAALYQVAASIPGVTVVPDSVDVLGRRGVAVALVGENGIRTEWIFDRSTLELLGERSVMVRNERWGRKGQVVSSTAIEARGIVDEHGQRPASVRS